VAGTARNFERVFVSASLPDGDEGKDGSGKGVIEADGGDERRRIEGQTKRERIKTKLDLGFFALLHAKGQT
jgi:hypothetical protein